MSNPETAAQEFKRTLMRVYGLNESQAINLFNAMIGWIAEGIKGEQFLSLIKIHSEGLVEIDATLIDRLIRQL